MNTIDLIIKFIEAGGFAFIVWLIIRGLKIEIKNLRTVIEGQGQTIKTQTGTLEAMEKRVEESEKFKELYKKFLSDLPEDIDNYKRILAGLKDEAIKELEIANKKKDEKLAELSKNKLLTLENQEKILEELPKLRENLINTHSSLEKKLSALDIFQPGRILYKLFKEMEEKAEQEQTKEPKQLTERSQKQ